MCRTVLVLLLVFELGKVGVVVDFLSVLSSGTLFMVRHNGLASCQVLHFCPDLTLAMCLFMADLWSFVWEFT